MMILAPHVSDPDADIFGELRQQVCYLHKLSSEGFRGVYREGDDLCWPPIEWVSRVSVEVSRPEEIPNEELVQNGLQIFTVNSDVVRARMGLISDDVLCEKFCREQEKIAAEAFFLDVQTRKELGQIGEDLTPLGNLLKAKVLRWENLREEYHSYPDAVPSAMFNLFKRMQAVRSRRRHTRSYRAENRLEL
ncbi:MAG: hypothetical protein HGA90_01050 [Alphaproteobacteria bacterium]|nr:hypothetical protein [Alphaproteobacteria bacterium]